MAIAVKGVDPQAKQINASLEDQIHIGKEQKTQNASKTRDASQAFTTELHAQGAAGAAYASRAKGVSDLMTASSDAELTASRNMDIVLSHTLSPEDYQKARQDGFDPSEIEAGETTTIVDHIKASLLQSGVEIAGVTDDLSREQLQEITGSAAYAEELLRAFHENDVPVTADNVKSVTDAVDRAGELGALSGDSLLYLVENEIYPSVDNLYYAAHAAKGRTGGADGYFAQEAGYLALKSEDADLTKMQPQIDDVLRRAGFDPADEDAQNDAKTLITAGVTLTEKHLQAAYALRELRLPPERDLVVRAGAAAIADGLAASKGDLTDPRSVLTKAAEMDRDTKALTDGDLLRAVENQPEEEAQRRVAPTLREMIDAMRVTKSAPSQENIVSTETLDTATEQRFMQARLQLEEVRLSMSVETNMTLIRSGFSIDTAPMEELIDRLRQATSKNAQALFAGTNDADASYRLYTETNFKTAYLKNDMPVGVIGALREEFQTDTLDDIFSKATTWKVANAAYETMQTEVRKDLGDNIKKAFRNADELLKNIGAEVTEDNLRAVRILSYNRMETTAENVAQVRAIDARLRQAIDDLKPAAVLDLIRDGKNPLQMTIDELAEELRQRNQTSEDGDEKYARFLYKLERAGEITGEERASYIGIYRMFETLERTDHAAIGTLLNAGAEMSIRNLLTATRTLRTADGKGVDVRADETFQGLEIKQSETAIDRQIDAAFAYYRAQADRAFAHLAPEKLAQLDAPEETLLPEFAEQMETLPEDSALDAAYESENAARLRQVLGEDEAAREEAAHMLETDELPLTTANLEAAQALRAGLRRDTKETLWEKFDNVAKDIKTSDIYSDLGEVDDYAEAYRQRADAMQTEIKEQMLLEETGYIAHRAMSLLHRQLSVAKHQADRGSFDIPVAQGGRTISMRVTLQTDEGQGSGVSITFDTEEYGTLSARMQIQGGAVTGALSTTYGQTPQVRAYMESVRDRFADGVLRRVPELAIDKSNQAIFYNSAAQPPEGNGDVKGASAKTLLQIAKVFTEAIE